MSCLKPTGFEMASLISSAISCCSATSSIRLCTSSTFLSQNGASRYKCVPSVTNIKQQINSRQNTGKHITGQKQVKLKVKVLADRQNTIDKLVSAIAAGY